MEPNFSSMTQAILSAYGYSEAELAKELQVSQPTVHRIKTGEVKNPGFTTGQALISLYEARPEQLPDAAA